jgi:hypothetical protein
MQSDTIGALAAALSKAQGAITGALKDSSNPFFKSKYADLASCWDACRAQLSENGLAVIQAIDIIGDKPVLITTLAHSSGEWIKSITPVLCRDDSPQAQGSGITYARRYALAAIVGLAQIDDDAEAAQARHKPKTEIDPDVVALINNAQTVEELTKLFKRLSNEQRLAHMAAFTARKKELTPPPEAA